jgi:hypothetical protein
MNLEGRKHTLLRPTGKQSLHEHTSMPFGAHEHAVWSTRARRLEHTSTAFGAHEHAVWSICPSHQKTKQKQTACSNMWHIWTISPGHKKNKKNK